MRFLRIIIPLIVIIVFIITGIAVLIYRRQETRPREKSKAPKAYEGTLLEFNHSPGYGDENGAIHDECLRQNKSGEWIIECRDLECIGEPMIVTTYKVSSDDVLAFEAFLKESGILDLQNRPESDEFMTDYRPWNYSMTFKVSSDDGRKRDYCSFSQYQQYSDSDRALIKELDEHFEALRGKVISKKKKRNY